MASAIVTLLKINGSGVRAPIAVKLDLRSSTRGCQLGLGGTLNCVARISVPPGSDTFSVVTYSQPGGAGVIVTSDTVTTSISAGKQTNCVKAAPSPATGVSR